MCDPSFVTVPKLADLTVEACVCTHLYVCVCTWEMWSAAELHVVLLKQVASGGEEGKVTRVLKICALTACMRIVSTTLRTLV